jgi:hypothetical protein
VGTSYELSTNLTVNSGTDGLGIAAKEGLNTTKLEIANITISVKA